jgi:hypothetical protein
MAIFRPTLLAGALLLLAPLPAVCANAFMTDASDLWWNPDESGWGVNIVQQSNVLFATFYVYAPDGRARWYSASDMRCPNTPTDQQMICTGTLYESTGPVVGPGFNPAAVTRRAVGEARFFYSRGNQGQFSYTVDGVLASKNVRRMTWALNDITGEYNGVRVTRPFPVSCSMPNVVTSQSLGTMTVSLSGTVATISTRLVTPALTCTYSGAFSQDGRMSAVTNGNYSCSDGNSGTFDLTEIEVSKLGFLGKISARQNGCNLYGSLGGTRATVEQAPD